MKIQLLNGGLANQVFQYIFARYYEWYHPGEIMYLDDSYFFIVNTHNGYELEKVFGVKPHLLSEYFEPDVWEYMIEERKKGKSIPQLIYEAGVEIQILSEVGDAYKEAGEFQGNVLKVPANQFVPQILDLNANVYYYGYWINRDWFGSFEKEFLEELSFPKIVDEQNQQYLQEIMQTKSVSMHIRRGDYVDLGWAMQIQQYHSLAAKFIQDCGTDWEIFVFSDDIPWCKENEENLGLTLFQKIHYVEGNMQGKNYIDAQLMSHCKGMIMSNSAFCYLAALLNQQKVAVLNWTHRKV